jgi:hypothetical protein
MNFNLVCFASAQGGLESGGISTLESLRVKSKEVDTRLTRGRHTGQTCGLIEEGNTSGYLRLTWDLKDSME